MRPEPASGFVANFIDPAFNDCLFMWDSCFMVMFGRYGARAFPFVRTLDNLYAKQHPDGFICREIGRVDGADRFFRHDPDSTGPNVLGWTEWEHYRNFGDRERLARVFPVLRAYHQWLRAFRTWPDGSYFSSGWGCGMDNQPRLNRDLPYYNHAHSHGWMTWVDTTLQQVLSARLLVRMAQELGAADDVADMREEVERLSRFVNAAAVGRDGRLLLRPLERRAAERRQDDRCVLGADRGRRAERAPRPLRRAPRRPAHVQPAAPRPVARRRHARVRPEGRLLARRRVALPELHGAARPHAGRPRRPRARDRAQRRRQRRLRLREHRDVVGELRAGVGRARRPGAARLRRSRAACRRSACCSSTSSGCGPTRRRGGSSGTCA